MSMGAGSSANSFLFHRITGNAYGLQMPPTGALRSEQIDAIKRWIDQGADWPDSREFPGIKIRIGDRDYTPKQASAVANADLKRDGYTYVSNSGSYPIRRSQLAISNIAE
jgi:hypothetical protein